VGEVLFCPVHGIIPNLLRVGVSVGSGVWIGMVWGMGKIFRKDKKQ
jgi:hypothetical protein